MFVFYEVIGLLVLVSSYCIGGLPREITFEASSFRSSNLCLLVYTSARCLESIYFNRLDASAGSASTLEINLIPF